jgi:chromosome partition protein MukB
MYGPARNAVVVSDLHGVKQKLTQLQDCPEDVYIIEGDVNAFDDSTMNVEELVGAVYVQANDQLVRYSVFPDVPLFGRAAREHRLEQLRSEREEIVEEYAKAAFDSQKLLRSYQSVADFVSQHIEQAFQQDPENRIDELNSKLIESRSQSETVRFELVEAKSQLENAKQVLSLLSGITPVIHLVDDDSLLISEQAFLKNLKEIKQSEVQVAVLEPSIESLRFELDVLKYDPQQHNTIEQEYQALDERLRDLKRKQFLLADLKERQSHFAYEDSTELLEQSSELSNNLRHKLSAADQNRGECRRHLKIAQEQFNQYNQVLVSLKTAHQAKAEMVEEFQQELQVVGVSIEDGVEEETIKRKEQLLATRLNIRDDKNSIQKRLTALEIDLKIVAKTIKSTSKTYRELRHIVVVAKANWCQVQRLARDNDVERRLNKRELAYLTAEELRSMSDKSLGALRVAVAGNSELRDALRASEETAYPVRKVMFFIAVYQHLKQRIRQDIIRTSDPVEAIEEMEIELARLTEELSMRENRLAISSDSVAAIIKKTIQREQVRIRLLNQGLSDITFGQVSGVRLNVNVRESHALLLSNLSEQQEQHSDLFKSSQLTFSESIAKLFQRVNPHIDMGQRSPQVLGEELLDYRSYLELSIEVNRGAEGWLQAESGALSTGEAIGTGQSILMMVIQSWEEESRRLRSKDIVPCRLLFLDEAARLDSKSISTLFELCDRLDMQLLIAAPENISPEQGTTYKLVRKVFNGREHVHVVGLKGFKKRATNLPLLEAG